MNSDDDLTLIADEHMHLSDVWVLDSGASSHMCSRGEWFMNYKQADGSVIIANGQVCKTGCIGSIRLRTCNAKVCVLNNVRHVAQVTKYLISLSLLDVKGFSFKGEGRVLYVYKGSKIILKGFKLETLYVLQGSALFESGVVTFVVCGSVEIQVQHRDTLDWSGGSH